MLDPQVSSHRPTGLERPGRIMQPAARFQTRMPRPSRGGGSAAQVTGQAGPDWSRTGPPLAWPRETQEWGLPEADAPAVLDRSPGDPTLAAETYANPHPVSTGQEPEGGPPAALGSVGQEPEGGPPAAPGSVGQEPEGGPPAAPGSTAQEPEGGPPAAPGSAVRNLRVVRQLPWGLWCRRGAHPQKVPLGSRPSSREELQRER